MKLKLTNTPQANASITFTAALTDDNGRNPASLSGTVVAFTDHRAVSVEKAADVDGMATESACDTFSCTLLDVGNGAPAVAKTYVEGVGDFCI